MRILILGPSGAGTSSLGKWLGQGTGIQQVESDDLFWHQTNPPFTSPRGAQELHALFDGVLARPSFIISGDVLNWGVEESRLLSAFTHLVYLYVPWPIRRARLLARERERFEKRIEVGGDMHESFINFLDWAQYYDAGTKAGRSRASQTKFMDQFKALGGKVIKFEKEISPDGLLQETLAFILIADGQI